MLSEGNTIVVQADSNDTVKSIHERIHVMTGIPVMEQRLIYRGKQLQWEQSLAECSIQNAAGLQLVGRETVQSSLKLIKSRMTEFFAMTPKDDTELAIGYLQIFLYSSAPAALVNALYVTNEWKFTPEDTLYLACRSTLGSLLENFGGSLWEEIGVLRATKDLTSSMEMVLSVGPLVSDVRDFTAFLVPLRKAILGQMGITCPIAVPLSKRGYSRPSNGDEIEYLHDMQSGVMIIRWLLEHKDVTNFESRRHLVMMMFPEYIARAQRDALHGGLFMEFKNEEATGPGVLQEWFFLVCQALFNQQNALFVACPNDRRRFYPNPVDVWSASCICTENTTECTLRLIASKVDPRHLDYFSFSGRIIALALMHKVQVGVVFDRVFFLQLAGNYISLEDIRDADPRLYDSCKQILEMDAEFIDSDALGLTFVRDVEELGSRKIVELWPGGKSMVVNSKNREEYVNLLIQHQFVTSISEQVTHFAKGFADILCNPRLQKFFFQSLELEDLDWMLFGS
ncbi:hypothetical protein Patl1_09695 [Pistacia atlantica]|uniref:Uncharacterized protein n=1 Tax=Pistacia atlantica TaxID=434234 RepID=A0ACC1A5Z4_9ROSI|nr:hypothetical protein Patl1_09695 [Pistacia atlantica]